MNDLIHYVRYIPCAENVDVPGKDIVSEKVAGVLAEVPMLGFGAHPWSKTPPLDVCNIIISLFEYLNIFIYCV